MQPERDTVLHSWCVQSDWNAPEVVGGEGARFFTADGAALIDMSSLAECSNLGHQHPAVVKAIQDQAARLCFVTSAWGAAPRAALAEALLARSGFEGGRVFFTLGGADANENAVKFARWAAAKPAGKVITRHRSYHGASPATMSLSGDSRAVAQPLAMPGVVHALPPYCYRCPFGQVHPACGTRCADHVAELFAWESPETVAAVLMEPHAGTNGIVAPPSYWPRLAAHCRANGVLLIADEVMSGFGRTGEWFAWQRHGEAGRPDMMTLAKGLTGAHAPLGAVVVSAAVAGKLAGQVLYTGLTYCGHPLSCAAGVAAVQAYADEGLVERSRQLGARMHDRLRGLMQRHAVVGDVRGDGLFAIVELVADRATRAPLVGWTQSSPALKALVAQGRAAGVSFAVRGNLVVLAPPLVITEAELDTALQVLDRLLGGLLPEGHR
ncbi:MAG: aminotransferase class III-fold pyridoxal phosphate-dependent enzyme [Burkholderiaceae bacterium]